MLIKNIFLTLTICFSISSVVFADVMFSGYTLQLKGTPDVENSASILIKADSGGVLEAKDRAGNLFRLTIPAKALLMDTVVQLQPITLSGVSGEANHIGVEIEPAGTLLYDLAYLEIIPNSDFENKKFASTFWLETIGSVASILARPGVVLQNGSKGIYLTHFSGASMVSGGNDLSSTMENTGVIEGNYDWYVWMRNKINQDFVSGKIDKITYNTKVEILARRSEAALKKHAQEESDKIQKKIDEATKRAEEMTADPDITGTEKFINEINIITTGMRVRALLGYDNGDNGAFKLIQTYIQKLYANCTKSPYGVKTTLALERLRVISGGNESEFDISKCFENEVLLQIHGEYQYRRKSEVKPLRGVNNVSDEFIINLLVRYSPKSNGASPTISAFESPKTKYQTEFETHFEEGEGCTGTQYPLGQYEVFEPNKVTRLEASYIPAMDFPPEFPLPPDMPRHQDAKGFVNISITGFTRSLGWKLSANEESCQLKDLPPAVNNINMDFNFDFAKLQKVGDKIIEDRHQETTDETEGWILTYTKMK